MRPTSEERKSALVMAKGYSPDKPCTTGARQFYLELRVMPVLLLAFAAAFAHAKNYTKIVVFGDSLSDTGNLAHLTEEKYGVRVPGPIADYTDGRFTDGFDTVPAAQNYFGVWVEQFAASLPSRPEIRNSLDGGTDYAYGFATTGSGTTVFAFGPSNSLFVQVNNIGQQITDYLATDPKINDSTLFVVWGGANDLLNAKSQNDIVNAAIQQTLNIQRLIDAGASQFIVANLPPLGLVPRFNGSPATSIPATEASALFNSWLATGISALRNLYPHRNMTIFELDAFTLFNQIVASPPSFSLTNATAPSQGILAAHPDTFLFWDDLHPTTRGHNILADSSSTLIGQHQCNAKDENCVFPVE